MKLIRTIAYVLFCAVLFTSCKSVHKLQTYQHASKDSVAHNDVATAQVVKEDSIALTVDDTSSQSSVVVEFYPGDSLIYEGTNDFTDSFEYKDGVVIPVIIKAVVDGIRSGKLKPKTVNVKYIEQKKTTTSSSVSKSDSSHKTDKTVTAVKEEKTEKKKEVTRKKISWFGPAIGISCLIFILLFFLNKKFRQKILGYFGFFKNLILHIFTP